MQHPRMALMALTLCACEGTIGLGNGTNPSAPNTQYTPNPDPNVDIVMPVPPTQIDNPMPDNNHAPPPPPEMVCQTSPNPGTAPTRRLSVDEYRNTITDILPIGTVPTLVASLSSAFVEDPTSLGFNNSAWLNDVKPLLAQQYMDAAEQLSVAATADLTKLLPCNQATAGELACATQFVKGFLRKAYRRVPTQAEIDAIVAVYSKGRAELDFKTGIQWALFSVLQAPSFLYRFEIDPTGATGTRALSGFEVASRLSYFIWASAPDDMLLTAAETGKLGTRAEVEAQARRLLADPRAKRLYGFFSQWLDWDRIPEMKRDPVLYPGIDANLPTLLTNETKAFVDAVLWQGDAKLSTMLSAPFTFVNDALAKHYKIPAPGSATNFTKVNYPMSSKRAGLFTLGGSIAVHDKSDRTSIVRRGMHMRTDVLCQTIAAPPNNVNLDLGAVAQGVTQAERLAQHRTDPACSGCHAMMDPIGSAFEGIDAVGRDRTVDEANRPLSTAGEFTQTQDINGPVANALEATQKLAQSDEVRQCVALQMFRFVHGRAEELQDRCSRSQNFEKFKATGFDLKELVVALTVSDDFLNRPVVTP